ncbi:MAG: hypothetical protein GX113_04430 [Actinobacteria bacterium]|jgi:hypothetical protein|nr:hypothetical protein [Actinomycetota bacterium]
MEMIPTRLVDMTFRLDTGLLMEKCRITPGTGHAQVFTDLVERVQTMGRPKAVYTEAYIGERGDDRVSVGGVRFTSRVLVKNLDQAERLFPFVATCGDEIDSIEGPEGDIRHKAWLYVLKQELVGVAVAQVQEHIGRRYQISKLSFMNPGSGDASVWPLSQQKELFLLLGDVEGEIGVRLTDSFLLIPEMSVSGVMFPTETDFHSCQVCRRERCPNRRAPLDQELWDELDGGA